VDEMKRFTMSLPNEMYEVLVSEMMKMGLDSIQSTVRYLLNKKIEEPVESIKGKVYSVTFGPHESVLMIGHDVAEDKTGIGLRFDRIFQKYEGEEIEIRVHPWRAIG
jgi:hypothetical protein